MPAQKFSGNAADEEERLDSYCPKLCGVRGVGEYLHKCSDAEMSVCLSFFVFQCEKCPVSREGLSFGRAASHARETQERHSGNETWTD